MLALFCFTPGQLIFFLSILGEREKTKNKKKPPNLAFATCPRPVSKERAVSRRFPTRSACGAHIRPQLDPTESSRSLR